MTSEQRTLLSEKFHWKAAVELDEMVQKVADLLSLDEANVIEFLMTAPVRQSSDSSKGVK